MRVLIVGGTSGIGWALAEHYLSAGNEVAVCGRDTSKVEVNKIGASKIGANKVKPGANFDSTKLKLFSVNVTDRCALQTVVDEYAREPIDLVIVSAGFYFNNRHHPLDEATTLRMLQTNVGGLNTVFELCSEKMLRQRSGHLVAIASVAGLLKDYPSASLYSACKRSVIQLCETYRIALHPFGIRVTTIIPGYINTAKLRELNNGDASKKPFLLSEADAVKKITLAIEQKQSVAIFPWQMRSAIWLMNRLPRWVLAMRS